MRRLVSVSHSQREHLLAITLGDAIAGDPLETLEATRQYPIAEVGKGFVPAAALGIGSLIVTRAGPPLVVGKIAWERRAEGYDVYNLIVEGDHTYFVGDVNGGVWVHNGSGNCYLPGADENGQLSLFTPEEPFDRGTHYGRTPNAAQKQSVPQGMLFDHEPPLAEHYYDGDGKGGIPGYMMTPEDRMAYGKSTEVGKPVSPEQRYSQGGTVKAYSMLKRKYWFGY